MSTDQQEEDSTAHPRAASQLIGNSAADQALMAAH